MSKSVKPLLFILALFVGTTAQAGIPGMDLPTLNFPQPTDTATRDCTTPGTLTGICAPKAH